MATPLSVRAQRNHVATTLTAVMQADAPMTAAQMGVSSVEAIRLREAGLIRQVSRVETGRRGRPAHTYRLTDKARKRVRRAIA